MDRHPHTPAEDDLADLLDAVRVLDGFDPDDYREAFYLPLKAEDVPNASRQDLAAHYVAALAVIEGQREEIELLRAEAFLREIGRAIPAPTTSTTVH
jgi:hypothetical protein